MGSPRRRNQRRDLQSPEALAAALPADLQGFPPVTDRDGFAVRARQIAEWLNTQSPVLGYQAPQVMAAGGLTASAWYRKRFALAPEWSPEPLWVSDRVTTSNRPESPSEGAIEGSNAYHRRERPKRPTLIVVPAIGDDSPPEL